MESEDFKKCVSDCTDGAHRVETDSNVTAAQRWAEYRRLLRRIEG